MSRVLLACGGQTNGAFKASRRCPESLRKLSKRDLSEDLHRILQRFLQHGPCHRTSSISDSNGALITREGAPLVGQRSFNSGSAWETPRLPPLSSIDPSLYESMTSGVSSVGERDDGVRFRPQIPLNTFPSTLLPDSSCSSIPLSISPFPVRHALRSTGSNQNVWPNMQQNYIWTPGMPASTEGHLTASHGFVQSSHDTSTQCAHHLPCAACNNFG